jgi:histidyl-tRNA synthetase
MNNRKVLNGFFNYLNIDEKSSDVLRVIDKLEKIGLDNVKSELGDLGLNNEVISKIIEFVGIDGSNDEIIDSLSNLGVIDELFMEGVSDLRQVVDNLRLFGVCEDYFVIDLTIARGLDYYTGTVYETKLDSYPELGSVCSGGRYDKLTEFYTDKSLQGIGISIGLTRLFFQLKDANIVSSDAKSLSKVLLVPYSKDNMNYILNVSKELRDKDIICDVYYEDKGMKQKMKYANRLGIPYVCIVGDDEEKENKVMLKDMVSGEQKLVSISEMIEMIK